MLKENCINHFGTQAALAKMLKISSPAISVWGSVIPEKQAFRLQIITSGELEYDSTHYQKAATE
jgi:hypothetical protein|tara:strand:- start:41 stop:232 length:192 start_codon:yes stop_codon:yes gene_type:complete